MQVRGKAEREKFKAALPSFRMENVRSLANKIDELEAQTRTNMEFW